MALRTLSGNVNIPGPVSRTAQRKRKPPKAPASQKELQQQPPSKRQYAAPPAIPFSTQAGLRYMVQRRTKACEWSDPTNIVACLAKGETFEVTEERTDTG